MEFWNKTHEFLRMVKIFLYLLSASASSARFLKMNAEYSGSLSS